MEAAVTGSARASRLCGLAWAASLAALVGCAPVSVTGAWRAPDYSGSIKRALVVGVFESPTDRRSLEDALAQALAKKGVEATPSYSFMPGERMPDADTFQGKLKGVEVEAVLVTRLVNVEKETVYVPPRTYMVPHPYYYRLHTYYGHAYHSLYEPGFVMERTIVSLETTLYDASSDRLIWTLATESFDPRTTRDLVEPLTRLIVERLQKDKLL